MFRRRKFWIEPLSRHERRGEPMTSEAPIPRPPRWGLAAVKVALLAVLGVQVLVGNRLFYWPMVPWTMYQGSTSHDLPETVDRLEVRATDDRGEMHRLLSDDLIPFAMMKAAEREMARAAAGRGRAPAGGLSPSRQFVANLARRAVGRRIVRVEVWRGAWRVDATAVPPLDSDRPVEMVRLAGYDVPPAASAWRRRAW